MDTDNRVVKAKEREWGEGVRGGKLEGRLYISTIKIRKYFFNAKSKLLLRKCRIQILRMGAWPVWSGGQVICKGMK